MHLVRSLPDMCAFFPFKSEQLMQQNPVLVVASVNHLVPNTMQRRRNHSCYMCYVMMVVALWGQGDVTYNYNSNFIQALALSHLGLIPPLHSHHCTS